MTYVGLTDTICQVAWEIIKPSIIRAAELNVTNKLAGTIVVLEPWTGDVLFQARVDNDHPDAEVYDKIALTKANVTWATKLPSRVVQQSAPHLYLVGMTKWGGAVIENGLVVSYSGVQPVYDEANSWSQLKWIIALCQNEMTKPGGVMETDGSFIGDLPPVD